MVDDELRAFINRLYRIRVKDTDGKTRLRGAGTLYKEIGQMRALELCSEVYFNHFNPPKKNSKSTRSKNVFKFWRSVEISFIDK